MRERLRAIAPGLHGQHSAELSHLLARDRVRGVRRQSRDSAPLRPSGASRETRRARSAFALCARTRSGSVRMPRIVSQHSNGDGTAPPVIWIAAMR